jgi:hypothetical protein
MERQRKTKPPSIITCWFHINSHSELPRNFPVSFPQLQTPTQILKNLKSTLSHFNTTEQDRTDNPPKTRKTRKQSQTIQPNIPNSHHPSIAKCTTEPLSYFFLYSHSSRLRKALPANQFSEPASAINTVNGVAHVPRLVN